MLVVGMVRQDELVKKAADLLEKKKKHILTV